MFLAIHNPLIYADMNDCDEQGFVVAQYPNAFQWFSQGQQVRIKDPADKSKHDAHIFQIDGDTLVLELA